MWYWVQAHGDYHEEDFTTEPDRVAVNEKQVQLKGGEKVWLYAAIDAVPKVMLPARLSERRGTDPAAKFLRKVKRNTASPMQSFSLMA